MRYTLQISTQIDSGARTTNSQKLSTTQGPESSFPTPVGAFSTVSKETEGKCGGCEGTKVFAALRS